MRPILTYRRRTLAAMRPPSSKPPSPRARFDPLARAQLYEAILEHLLTGQPITRFCARPGMPPMSTIGSWRRRDPGFADRYLDAWRRGRWRRFGQFDPELAEAFLARYRTGEAMVSIHADPAMPSVDRVRQWRRTQAPFAEEIGRLKATHAQTRGNVTRYRRGWVYSQDLADRIVSAVYQGAKLKRLLLGNPHLPGYDTVQRWRREHPELDRRLAWAWREGLIRRHRAERRANYGPHIVDRIRQGHSLQTLGRMRDMPCTATLSRWLREDRELDDAVARACVDREDWYEEQIIAAADTGLYRSHTALMRATGPIRRHLVRLRNRPGRAWQEKRWRKREGL